MADKTYTPYGVGLGAAINHALKDPLQGFDADVWVMDQATGNQTLVGRFTSLQVTIRNATEPYLELNQRIPRMLDGEFQFGWVLERGLVDTRILEDTFGWDHITREMRVSRSPRMVISFDLNAPELDEYGSLDKGAKNTSNLEPTIKGRNLRAKRSAQGQYRLVYCKVDSLTLGIMAGRQVIATRWEGLAEGITFIENSQLWAGVTQPTARTPEGGFFLDKDFRSVFPDNTVPEWIDNLKKNK